jgi:hypothetical protein
MGAHPGSSGQLKPVVGIYLFIYFYEFTKNISLSKFCKNYVYSSL